MPVIDVRVLSLAVPALKPSSPNVPVIFLLGIPISLSQGIWKEITIAGMTFLDFADFLTAQVMMPIGGLLIALFVGWRLGPRAVEALKSHPDQRLPLAGLWLFILRFVAPLGIAWILAQGLFE